MTTTENRPADRRSHRVKLPDFGAIALGDNPDRTRRILGLIRAGHTRDYIIRLGHYQQAWSPADVDHVLEANRAVIPEPPDASRHSAKETSATMVPLTGPQMRLVHCLCQGMTNDAAAAHLGITPPTVRTQLRTVLDICGASCDRDLIAQILTGRLTPIEDTD
jgi:DNA-binding CsgD family transcriptional regulator